MIGLCGAERTGKSTLARAYAEKHDLAYLPSRASEIFRSMDLPMGPLPAATRLAVQRRILDGYIADIRAASGPWIADRTPIDMAGYALLDLQGTEVNRGEVESYVSDCIDAANNHLSMIVVVPPGIPYVEEDGKPKRCEVRQALTHFVFRGLTCSPVLRVPVYAMRGTVLALEERLDVLHRAVGKVTEMHVEEMTIMGATLH